MNNNMKYKLLILLTLIITVVNVNAQQPDSYGLYFSYRF